MTARCSMAMVACLLGTTTGAFGQAVGTQQQSLLPLPSSNAWQQSARASELSQVYAPRPAAYTSPYRAPAAPHVAAASPYASPYASPAAPHTAHYNGAPASTTYTAWQDDAAPAPPMPEDTPHGIAVDQNSSTSSDSSSCGSCAFDEALSGPCMSDCYAGSDCGFARFGTPCGPRWSARLGALIMTRDDPNTVWLTFDNTQIASALLGTRDAAVHDWKGGFEVGLSRMIGNEHAIGVTYWTLDRFEEAGSVRSDANILNTSINLNGVTIGGTNADQFFDAAREHRVSRTNEFHNIEINLMHMPVQLASGSPVSLNWLAGVRYFRFDEGLLFGAVSGGNEFGSAGGTNEAYLDIDVLNNLVGFQLGTDGRIQVLRNVALFGSLRGGIYGNHVRGRTMLYRGDGLEGFNIQNTENDVSMLGELNLGMEWQPASWFSTYLGYRAVFVSGVALSDAQIPPFLADARGIEDLDTNGELILHGLMIGGQLLW